MEEDTKKVFIKNFGCQMNVYDSELVGGILSAQGYTIISDEHTADIVLIVGCTVREHAEKRALGYLQQVLARKKRNKELIVGLLSCLGQWGGSELQEKLPELDIIAGPDAYRNLPALLSTLPEKSFVASENPLEDYDDVQPLRRDGASAYIAIMRGCNHRCGYCVVPYMRGSERSRPTKSILTETENLVANGVKEVFLIGQNVNSYQYNGTDFPALLDAVSGVSGVKRIRFTTSHPKNLSEKLVEVIRDRENVCSHIHLPLQSGSDRVLSAMGREYTVERYLSLIFLLRQEIPEVSITTDIISGYPGETVDDHQRTLDLVQTVEFDGAFTFKYSPRLNTPAFKLKDDVPEAEKIRRLNEISNLQRKITERKNKLFIGKTVTVLVEIASKRSDNDMLGRTDCGRNVIIHNQKLPIGTLCTANITAATSQTLLGAFQSILK